MSAGEYLELDGKVSRLCPECRVEITISRPPRPLSGTTGNKARKHLGAELRRQVLWEALQRDDGTPCVCKEFWNALIKRCEEGLKPKRRTAA